MLDLDNLLYRIELFQRSVIPYLRHESVSGCAFAIQRLAQCRTVPQTASSFVPMSPVDAVIRMPLPSVNDCNDHCIADSNAYYSWCLQLQMLLLVVVLYWCFRFRR
jgi:hypothetical protein